MQLHGRLAERGEADEKEQEQRDAMQNGRAFAAAFLGSEIDCSERHENTKRTSKVHDFEKIESLKIHNVKKDALIVSNIRSLSNRMRC